MTVPWESDMKAGFTLAALLLDDRAFARVASALPPGVYAELAPPAGDDVAALLRVLQPELTLEDVEQLPPRMRALLARRMPARVRRELSGDAPPSRPNYVLDEQLLRALVRLARKARGQVRP